MEGRIITEKINYKGNVCDCYIPQMKINKGWRTIVSKDTVLLDRHMADVLLKEAIAEHEDASRTLTKYPNTKIRMWNWIERMKSLIIKKQANQLKNTK